LKARNSLEMKKVSAKGRPRGKGSPKSKVAGWKCVINIHRICDCRFAAGNRVGGREMRQRRLKKEKKGGEN